MANGGKGFRAQDAKSRISTRKPSPPFATVCCQGNMVRRGSTVRVRQRALGKGPQARAFCFLTSLHFSQYAQVWNRFWNSQTQDGPILSSGLATEAGEGPRFGVRVMAGLQSQVHSRAGFGQTSTTAYRFVDVRPLR